MRIRKNARRVVVEGTLRTSFIDCKLNRFAWEDDGYYSELFQDESDRSFPFTGCLNHPFSASNSIPNVTSAMELPFLGQPHVKRHDHHLLKNLCPSPSKKVVHPPSLPLPQPPLPPNKTASSLPPIPPKKIASPLPPQSPPKELAFPLPQSSPTKAASPLQRVPPKLPSPKKRGPSRPQKKSGPSRRPKKCRVPPQTPLPPPPKKKLKVPPLPPAATLKLTPPPSPPLPPLPASLKKRGRPKKEMPKTQGAEAVARVVVNPYKLYGYIGFGNNRRRRTKATKRCCNNKNSSCNSNEIKNGVGITSSLSPASLTMREHGSGKEEGQKIVTSNKKKGIVNETEVIVHDEIIYISDDSNEEEEDEGWSRKRPRSRSLKSLM